MKIEIGSQEWLEARRNLITATDAAIILGVSPFKTPLQLYYNKINGTDTEQTGAMKRGLDLEPKARAVFEEMTGNFVYPEFRIHKELEWMAASFDGINDEGMVLEIKCPGKVDHEKALKGEVPEKYYPQLQHQMYVAGVDQCYYFSYHPDHIPMSATIEVKADKEFQDKMIEAEKEFWDALQNRIPPDPLDRDLQVRDDKEWLSLENELADLLIKRENLDQREKELRGEMINLCDGKPTQGMTLKFNPIYRRGSVDYKAVPQLKGVNLDSFRKPACLQWRLDRL